MKTQNVIFKKTLVVLLAILMLFTYMPSTAWADPDATTSINVNVSVSKDGAFVTSKDGNTLAMQEVTLTGKASYTIDDVFKAVHNQLYDGDGSSAYAATAESGVTEFWGIETSNVGYYNNGAMSMGVTDAVADGAHIEAFIYQNSYSYTEGYAKFDNSTATIAKDEALKVKLTYVSGYGGAPDYAPIFSALEGATITIDGVTTETTTDSNGEATITLSEAGTHIISAVKTKELLSGDVVTAITAPVCKVNVVAPINVRVGAQKGTAYTYMPEVVSVPYGIAAKYGFSNGDGVSDGTITALDALVAAHVKKYGESFTSETAASYLAMSNGNPTKSFGDNSTGIYSGFAVNHDYYKDATGTGYNVNTAPLKDGDVVDFFYYEDDQYKDVLSWFETSQGNVADEISVEAGESAELFLKGFVYMNGYLAHSGTAVYSEENALSVYTIPASGDVTNAESSLYDISTNDGKVTLKFDQAGTYEIAAMGYDGNSQRVIMPYCKVNVVEKGTITDNKASKIAIQGVTYNFDKDTYTYNLPDQIATKATLVFTVTASTAKSITATVNDGNKQTLTSGKSKYLSIAAGTNTIKINIEPNSDSIAKSYIYTVKRNVALSALTLQDNNGNAISLGEKFNANTLSYTTKVVAGSKIKLSPTASPTTNTEITVNDAAVASEGYTINEGANTFTIKVASKDNTVSKTYTLTVTGIKNVGTSITGPEGMNLRVWDFNGVMLENPAETNNNNGTVTYSFTGLATGETYEWAIGKYGYISKSGSFTPADDENDNVVVTLTQASTPTSSITAQWKNFRNSDSNMAIVSVDTPTTASETSLKWTQTLKSASSTWANPGTYIIVNNKIVYASGDKISLINKDTGAIEKTTTMAGSKGYAYMPPVYGGGMIYVALNNGMIQAFDATTLESCWVYHDKLGGQALSNITYDNGYIYTGFWAQSGKHNYVCLSAQDEDLTSTEEEKTAVWERNVESGFYWSGAYVQGDYIVVGCDKGLYVFNKETGEVTDSNSDLGVIRSSVSESNGVLYFTSKTKGFCAVTVDGSGKITASKTVSLGGESTSTPVVVGNYAYVGVKISTKDTNITQVNLTTNAITKIATSAYSQSSLLANTKDSDYTYLYFTCNAKPGGVECLKVNNSTGEMQIETIYKPETDKQDFCIASLMSDEQGNLYYYNDSGYLFALEKKTVSSSTYKLSFDVKDTAGNKLDDAQINILSVNGNAATTYTAENGAYTVKSGIYKYEVTKNGYKTLTAQVNVSDGDASVPVVLQKEGSSSGSGSTTPAENTVTVQVLGYKGAVLHDTQSFTLTSGMTALSVLQAIPGISVDWENTQYGLYVAAIDGLGEFDKGSGSGWMYKVNGIFPSYSAGDYKLKAGDKVVWVYTEDLGNDVGGGYATGTTDTLTVTTTGTTGSVTTTSPTDVKVTEKTNTDGTKEKVAEITVSSANQKEILSQAKANKSKEIVLNALSDSAKDAGKVDVKLDKSFVNSIVSDTDAKLTVKTPLGDKTYTQDELKTLAAAATGSTVTLTVEKADAQIDTEDGAASAEEIAEAQAAAKDAKAAARSVKTKKGSVKVTYKPNSSAKTFIQSMEDKGYTVKYRFYRSTKKSSGYKAMLTKDTKTYINTSGKSGTRYYYKTQIRVYDKTGKLIAKTALKDCKYATRVFGK